MSAWKIEERNLGSWEPHESEQAHGEGKGCKKKMKGWVQGAGRGDSGRWGWVDESQQNTSVINQSIQGTLHAQDPTLHFLRKQGLMNEFRVFFA